MKTIQHCSNICDQCDLPEPCFASMHSDKSDDQTQNNIQKTLHIKKNESLYRQDEKFRGMFIVKKGGVKAYLSNYSGQEVITAFYLPGALVGFSSFSSEAYIENAKAFEDAELCLITQKDFMRLLGNNHAFQKALMISLSDDLRKSHIDQHTRTYPTAKQKIARFILEYLKRMKQQLKTKTEFYFLPTQQDMGNFLGLAPETVSRVLSQFQKEEIMTSGSKQKYFHFDCQRLEALIVE